jgi:hypothetical protein
VSGAPGLLSWPAGWRLPGRLPGRLPRYDAPPRPQSAPAAPALDAEDYQALYAPERACRDGHDVARAGPVLRLRAGAGGEGAVSAMTTTRRTT